MAGYSASQLTPSSRYVGIIRPKLAVLNWIRYSPVYGHSSGRGPSTGKPMIEERFVAVHLPPPIIAHWNPSS